MEKIKQFLESEKWKDILVVLIIILVGLGSFGLGRLSKKGNVEDLQDQEGLKIEYNGQEANAVGSIDESLSQTKKSLPNNDQMAQSSNSKNFFASSRGSKYYSLGCSGGKTIKQENRIYFGTKEEAEEAGYELSSACH